MELNLDDTYYKAILAKDSSYEGTFITGVKTTGIFCRPTCRARKPKRENVEFFKNTKEAILSGYRPCKVCSPLEHLDETPEFIKVILEELTSDPSTKFKDWDLLQRGIQPSQIRRWFLRNHGMTFQAYQRAFRINSAFKKIQNGAPVTSVAFDSGFESLSGFGDSFKAIFGISPKNSKDKRIIDLARLETPLGTMFACATAQGICLLEFSDRKMLETELKAIAKYLNATIMQGENKHFDTLRVQLTEYFEGKRTNFSIPIHSQGTDFQQAVWEKLQEIPYGETSTYLRQAIRLNRSEAVRAVGNANGMNRISIIIPCHRVVGTDGSLTGYGGGLWRKKWLLDHEKQHR
ncbi:bifunctional transcriptional activator/DNA repair enzyme AdaA [Pedobacter steynii]|uniref:Methylated-DNA--protein-cysteine methyltransferase n=1 Tax=Pedobacter steynii TaxID=430522 RepID=A0A1D7QQL4_9SPHI|nr:methylated-DNA--[protein]-cysteine S-methyltransferase [Pedobacter steynii]AOM80964.1 XRE family transcriptional regulator [Pedobacter steynii]